MRYRTTASSSQTSRVRGQLAHGTLEALMEEAELKQALQQAWWRIAHTFAGARSARGRRATPGYLVGLNGQLSSVALYIMSTMSPDALTEIYAATRLPEKYTAYVKGTPAEAARRVVQELLLRQLVAMRDQREIYYMEGEGEWRIAQTALTDYHRFVRRAVPNPQGRADYRRGTQGPRIRRPLPRQVRRELAGLGAM